MRLELLVDNLMEVISHGVPQDVLEGVLPRCSSNLNSSDVVLDPVADHADVQLADWDHGQVLASFSASKESLAKYILRPL